MASRSAAKTAVLSLLALASARADVVLYTGTLASPASVLEQTFVLSGTSNVLVETFGFGGGTDLAGTSIAAGGFDPLIALFSGTGSTATILTDSLGNPIANADTLTNFVGNCPPSGYLNIGGSICGDAILRVNALAAGTYTLLLSDANYIPLAVDPGPPSDSLLSDGFLDFTGGVFQTCNGNTCITPNGNYAVDLGITSVPEPRSAVLLGTWLAALMILAWKRKRATAPRASKGGKHQ